VSDVTAAPLAELPRAGGTSRFPALESRSFRLFWCGQMISLVGTWVQSVAQQWLVLEITHSAFQVGLIVTVQFFPVLALSLLIGPLTDRMDKRLLLIATQVGSMILAAMLGTLVLLHVVQYWHILLIALGSGIIQAFYVPTRQSFVPELVDRSHLLNAVALNSAIFNAARVVGPAIGGLLYGITGPAWAFYINAVSYVAVIVGLMLIRRDPNAAARAPRPATYFAELTEGLRYVRNSRPVMTLLLLIGTSSLFALNFTTLLPVFARFNLHLNSSGFGLLLAFQGAGALLAAIVLSIWSRGEHVRRLVYGGAFAFLGLELGFAFVQTLPLAAAILLPCGFAMTIFTTTVNSRILDQTPANLQGRVMSVYSFLFLGMTPIGSLAAGAVAEKWGAPSAFVIGASATLMCTVVIFSWRNRDRRRAQVTVTS
jgi:MFS family permease